MKTDTKQVVLKQDGIVVFNERCDKIKIGCLGGDHECEFKNDRWHGCEGCKDQGELAGQLASIAYDWAWFGGYEDKEHPGIMTWETLAPVYTDEEKYNMWFERLTTIIEDMATKGQFARMKKILSSQKLNDIDRTGIEEVVHASIRIKYSIRNEEEAEKKIQYLKENESWDYPESIVVWRSYNKWRYGTWFDVLEDLDEYIINRKPTQEMWDNIEEYFGWQDDCDENFASQAVEICRWFKEKGCAFEDLDETLRVWVEEDKVRMAEYLENNPEEIENMGMTKEEIIEKVCE